MGRFAFDRFREIDKDDAVGCEPVCFEQLEPRLLMSASPADAPVDEPEQVTTTSIAPDVYDAAGQGNTTGSAVEITEDITLLDLSIHEPGDQDFFTVRSSTADTLKVILRFDHTQGDLLLRLRNNDGKLLTANTSTPADGKEKFEFNINRNTRYWIEVLGASGATSPKYRITFDIPEPEIRYGRDRYERVGGQDGSGAAIKIHGDVFIEDLSVHKQGDKDWYQVTPDENGLLTAEIRFSNAGGDIKLEWIDETGVTTYNTTNDIEQFTANVNAGQTYWVRIKGAPNDDYSLLIDMPGSQDVGDRLISFDNIAGSSDDPALRYVDAVSTTGGWTEYVATKAVDQINWGFNRLELHNPFGRTELEGPMPADQYLEALDGGFTWLTDDFVSAWQPITSGAALLSNGDPNPSAGEPVEVIAYFGSFEDDPDFIALRQAGDLDGWMARAFASVQPAIDAGMSIGLDSLSDSGTGDFAFGFATMLRDMGHKVYIESWPSKGFEHWQSFNIVVNEPRYRDTISGAPENFLSAVDFENRATRLIRDKDIRGIDDTDPVAMLDRFTMILAQDQDILLPLLWLDALPLTSMDLQNSLDARLTPTVL